MSGTVFVKNISGATSEKEIKEFFSFCGKVSKIDVTSTGETKEAVVTFEKPTAAKTALLLDGTQLQSNIVSVSSSSSDDEHEEYAHQGDRDTDEITQEEKPRSRIIAEYLAHGYAITDMAAQRAIDLDKKHGVSSRFIDTLTQLDAKYHATDRAKTVDQTYGVTDRANSLLSGLTSYFEKAAETPTGKRIANFYTQSQRQVIDIHNEARRLADIKKRDAAGVHTATESGKTTCKCGSKSGSCPCAPGTCGCANCGKSEVRTVPGTENTTCSCGGAESDCPCEAGHCACSSCPKALKSASTHETAQAGTGIVDSTKITPLDPQKGAQ